MNKKVLIIILLSVALLMCIGLVILGVIFIPKILSTNPGDVTPRVCEITNCHGLDIKCGDNPPDMCTEEYLVGDSCRKFAECSNVGSTCSFIPNTEFSECKNCVDKCKAGFNNDNQVSDQFDCAESCQFQVSGRK
jgi:hypothetical protein